MFTKFFYKILLITFVFTSFFSFVSMAQASTFVEEYFIENDTVWTKENSPYILNHSLKILNNATLTIEPGVEVKFKKGFYSYERYGLNIAGKLIAQGTKENPIYFTSYFDDTLSNTDDYEICDIEEYDEDGNLILKDGCQYYDTDNPDITDWNGFYFDQSSGISILENVSLNYSGYGITVYKSEVNLDTVKILNSRSGFVIYDFSKSNIKDLVLDNLERDGLTVFNNSIVDFVNINIKNVTRDPVSVFNNSSLIGSGLNFAGNLLSDIHQDIVAIFNNSIFSIEKSIFKDCPLYSCIVVFDGYDYLDKSSSLSIKDTVFENGLGVAISIFGDSKINASVNDSRFGIFDGSVLENYLSDLNLVINAENNFWNDDSGPYHESLNPNGKGGVVIGNVDFNPWVGQQGIEPEEFYAPIKNAPNGIAQMYSEADDNSVLLKTFPNDWILKVFKETKNADGWIKVEDMTDGSTGFIKLDFKYEKKKQIEYEEKSKTVLNTKKLRSDKILEIVEHYYNDTSTVKSLYSSDDNFLISKLKNINLPKELILAIFAQESGSVDFDNENVSFDFGHGISQVTIHAKVNSKKNSVDPRGQASLVKLEICRNILLDNNKRYISGLDEYKNCYKQVLNSKEKLLKNEYDNYKHIEENVKYKQYTNTEQSMYANIKDGLSVLRTKYKAVFNNPCSKDVILGSLIFTCNDINIIKSVWGYNGASLTAKDYLGAVSGRLKTLNKNYNGIFYDNNDLLIEKLAYAGKHRVELKAHSPIQINIRDLNNSNVGLVDGIELNDISTGAYDEENERAVIFFPEDSYTYEVVGDSEGGNYGLDIDIYDDSEEPISFRSIDLPIIPGEKHIYKVNEEKLKNNEPDSVAISIDKNGDGLPEKTIYSGNQLLSLEDKVFEANNTPQAGFVPIWALGNIVKSTVLGAQTEKTVPEKEVQKSNSKKLIKNKKINKKDKKKNEVNLVKKELKASAIDSEVNLNWFDKLILKLFGY